MGTIQTGLYAGLWPHCVWTARDRRGIPYQGFGVHLPEFGDEITSEHTIAYAGLKEVTSELLQAELQRRQKDEDTTRPVFDNMPRSLGVGPANDLQGLGSNNYKNSTGPRDGVDDAGKGMKGQRGNF